MKHTPEEIIKALNIIKEECEGNPNCVNCPFYYFKEICFFADKDVMPFEWTLNEPPEDVVWKPFSVD